ncbi:DUF1173 family protein [Nocardia terpenica]|uniref:DUF1173 family protein n=1 Tax=Nocardia terpenica TaxID=455432 RepID=A0A164PGR3_9NOCA|nr:DUF1173 family protein [Nocardia terpenica]KZM75547.1 hypothetical protein AWN90_19415 [Nocardia terpenica]NQE86027.1 DUF1173 family protein [Nocardia terpenica]
MYVINGQPIDSDHGNAQAMLAAAHATGTRPRCTCQGGDGGDMYIAKVSGRYLIKRMPGTGSTHDPMCTSYALPPEVSGLAHLLGKAVKEQPETTRITLGFPLTHHRRRVATAAAATEVDDSGGDPTKLTLRGLLHLLWDDAGFTRWTPGMLGKRNWATIRKYLLCAAEDKTTNRTPLVNRLWIPETFNSESKAEIIARRTAALSHITGNRSHRRLMIAVGEIKRITPTITGAALLFKHVPDLPLHLANETYTRMVATFDTELSLRADNPDTHLIGILTFGESDKGTTDVEQIAVMTVTQHWIPVTTPTEKHLVDRLTDDQRRFVKSLRYNQGPDTPMAALTLIDTSPVTACYIIGTDDSDLLRSGIDSLISTSQLDSWIFDAANETPPPAVARRDRRSHDEPDQPTLDIELPDPPEGNHGDE